MVVTDDLPHQPQRAQLAAQPIADHRVLLDQLELGRGQARRLEQDRIGDADLADVVQVAAAIERRDLVFREAERPAERDREPGESLAVAVGVGIARVDRQRQALEDGFGRLEVVGVALEAHQRREPRVELLGIERLGEKVVGADVNPAHAVLARVQAGNEDHRHQPGSRHHLQPRAHLEAVEPRQPDVEQDDVDVDPLEQRQRLFAVGQRDDVVFAAEETGQQLSIRFLVVDNENAGLVTAGGTPMVRRRRHLDRMYTRTGVLNPLRRGDTRPDVRLRLTGAADRRGQTTRPGHGPAASGVDVVSESRDSSRAAIRQERRQRRGADARRQQRHRASARPRTPSRRSRRQRSAPSLPSRSRRRLSGSSRSFHAAFSAPLLEHVEGVDVRRLAKGLNQVAGIEPRQRIGAAAGVGLGSREDRPEQFGRHRLVAARVDHRPAHVLHPRKDRRVRGQERAESRGRFLTSYAWSGLFQFVLAAASFQGSSFAAPASNWRQMRGGPASAVVAMASTASSAGDADQGGAGRSNRCGAHVSSLLVNRSSLDSDEETSAIVAGAARKNQ